MGMTFVINSLEEMCDAMCDNIVPEEKNPVICAECQHFVDVFSSPKCEKTGKRVYNSKPDWCPLPLWDEVDDE